MIKFYTDSHIAKTIVAQLRQRNVDVVRCQEVGRDDADDVEHLEYATSQGRTVITSDADFLALSSWTHIFILLPLSMGGGLGWGVEAGSGILPQTSTIV